MTTAGKIHENYTAGLSQAFERGALVTAAGNGRVASASRDDLALAAAIVLTTPGHEGAVYELTGPAAWSFDELAEEAARLRGTALPHTPVPAADVRSGLLAAGLPEFLADLLVDIHVRIGEGALAAVHPDLDRLIGRPATPIATAVADALA